MITETFGSDPFGTDSIDLTQEDDPPQPYYNDSADDDVSIEVPFGQIQTKVTSARSVSHVLMPDASLQVVGIECYRGVVTRKENVRLVRQPTNE